MVKGFKRILCAFFISNLIFSSANAQSWKEIEAIPSTLFAGKGIERHATENFGLQLAEASQTAVALSPATEPDFDYTPGDRLKQRDKDGMYQLGDINIKLRKQGEALWSSYSTAKLRKPVTKIVAAGNVLAAADLEATLPSDIPVAIKRFWEKEDGNLILRFEITNNSETDIEIGSLGIPLIFNNILQGKNLDQAHAQNVFSDPYIGADAGYVLVNRLHGKGQSLLVLPHENASFEAYNPLLDDPTPRHVVFEGFHEWMIHSKAYAENDWQGVEQWNQPTSTTLKRGKSKNYALKFVLAPSIREIENELIFQKRPVAVGLPGYVLPQDETFKLFIKSPQDIYKITVYPKNALSVVKTGLTPNRWTEYEVKGKQWGRARVTIEYKDKTLQTVHYKVIKPQAEVVADLGNFLTTEQWYDDPEDIFKRAPSIMNYDYDVKRILTQERRAWFVGLSDEAGAGSWLAAVMKQLIQPKKEEIDKIKRFVDETMWGKLQYSSGPRKYGVVKSLFFYQPDSVPAGTYSDSIVFKGWEAWPIKEAQSLDRSYNYPHVAAAHWVLYRLAKYHNMENLDWKNSLVNAYETSIAMIKYAPSFVEFGQMEGSVFVFILKDLYKEGFAEQAAHLEMAMKKRTDHWCSLNYPFGSEMPWDSTGQEEVYMWTLYFGFLDKAETTLNAILAYVPAVPHWGYNGSARRYWDFMFGGKLGRTERQLHHYGSALNAIPLLTAYRNTPDDFYLLRIGHAGMMGALANITQDGFGSCAFHSFPSTLEIDGYAGDYGSGFYGYAVNSGTYIAHHPEFGWTAFSGNLKKENDWIRTEITCGGQNRVFLAPKGVWLTTVSGKIEQVDYNEKTDEIRVKLSEGALFDIEIGKKNKLQLSSNITRSEEGYYMTQTDGKGEKMISIRVL